MPADREPVHGAADILRSIDEMRRGGMTGDKLSASLDDALNAFDKAPCRTLADALALISMSRRITQMIVVDLAEGRPADVECAMVADRYIETAITFIEGERMRREHGHFAGYTLQ